ncbi:MAG: hypothetical protein ACREH8_09505 [Opitutaceae bacterium]
MNPVHGILRFVHISNPTNAIHAEGIAEGQLSRHAVFRQCIAG